MRSGSSRKSRRNGGPQGSLEEQTAAQNRIRSALQDLLPGLAASLNGLSGNVSTYDSSLQEHRKSLEKMTTLHDFRELEKMLLLEVESVQSANNVFRSKLDKANAKVAEQRQELEQLQSAVSVDFLTEIPNRRALDDRMKEAMSLAKRHGTIFSLVLFDIDRFKAINDTHGHAAGDRVLRAIAHLFNDHKRTSDFLARFGGEEFVLLLPETSIEGAQRLAEKTRQRVAEANFQFQKQKIGVTISAGVGEIDPKNDTEETFFSRVDAALYHAKESGRNRVELAESAPLK